MPKKNIFLIDASSFCYRAFFAIKELSTSYGQPTNAVYGFITMLNKILKERKPDHMAICFDVGKDTFRQRRFKEYKIHRPPMPDSLSSQLPIIEEVIKAYNLATFAKEGFEADDVIATCVEEAKKKDLTIYIITGDKDILQLVDKDTFVYNPSKDIVFTREKVEEHFGVAPEKIKELIALMGDAADNIPGVKGIGSKTAVSLISEFKDLKNLLSNLPKVKSDKLRELLEQSKDIINLSEELAELKKDVDLDFNLDNLKVGQPNKQALFEIFKRLEFKRLLKQVTSEAQALPKPKVEKITSEEKASSLLDKVSKDKEIALFLQKDLLSMQDKYDNLILCDRQGSIFSLSLGLKAAGKLLSDKDIKKIGHDLKTIKLNLRNRDIDFCGMGFDTMIAGYLLNPAKVNYALEDCLLDYLDISVPEGTDEVVFLQFMFKLKESLEGKLESHKLFDLFFNLEMPLVDVLAEMEIDGITVDQRTLKEISVDLEKRQNKLLKEVFKMAREEFNLNSPKQLSGILFQKLNIKPIKKTKTGFSTNEEVLKQLSKKHEICKVILKYREIAKLKSTYADGLLKLCDKQTGKLYSSFIQTGTETGRLSSREPNLQNIPIRTELGRGIRKVLVASGGCVLLSADYSQIELRVLAYLSGDANLVKAFQEGKDIHSSCAALIYDVELKDVTADMRSSAKAINFGIAYGMSTFGLSKELGISREEAESFIDAYFLRYPKVKNFMQETISFAEKNGYVTTMMDRRRYLEGINSRDINIKQFSQRQAINTPVQGSAADIIKQAMLLIHGELLKNKLSSRMILQVHDELLFDVASGEIEKIKEIVKDKMENSLKLSVPLKVNMKVGKNWLDMKEVG